MTPYTMFLCTYKSEELIDMEHGAWDEDLLAVNFLLVDMEVIFRIPLGHLTKDTWVWHLERSGEFLVRSVYKAIIVGRWQCLSSSSKGSEQKHLKRIWKLQVPPKLCNFWWRVIKNFLPCKAIPKDIHIERIAFLRVLRTGRINFSRSFIVYLGEDFLEEDKDYVRGEGARIKPGDLGHWYGGRRNGHWQRG